MEIQTSHFGTQSINESDVLTFPNGLLGFEEHTQFKLFHEESSNPTVHWLQSVTGDQVSMSVVSPVELGLEYEIMLTDEDEVLLELDDINDAQVILIVYKQDEKTNANFKAIIRAPLVINTKKNIGLQKHLEQVAINEAA
ncbi:MAG: flagellar biosynthesis protein FliW [Methylophaga sp.]|nr:flagellar biosynthesis protein FliW [Methylophaga sp.]